ncbi:MAG TPA: hypothetical protein VHV76_15720 [Mycobacteriales bacterium]|jgi:hypothetical protein|nr:hypothetical protein [Mycobacteriales bacterium]
MRVPVVAAWRSLLCASLLLTTAAVSTMSFAEASPTGVHGGDISWPNCPKGEGIPSRRSSGEPLPDSTAKFVIVGVTNGPGFHPNPCLADQLLWVSTHRLRLGAYAMTTFPRPAQLLRYGQQGPYDGSTARGALRNAGYAEASYNLSTMTATGMLAPVVWVDVEPYPAAPWPHNHGNNRAVITGAIKAYTDAGHRVGIYTYANGWRQVVGGWRLPNLPAWSTIGHGSATGARKVCKVGPSGGPNWIVQWWRNDSRDRDLICPAAPAQALLFTAPPD